MKLSDDEAKEFQADGRNPKRRENFRAVPSPYPPTFELYIAALEDLFAIYSPPMERPRIPYHNVKL